MSTTYPQLRVELQKVLPWLIPIISEFSATGTTTTWIDTALLKDVNSSGLTDDLLKNSWILRPAAAALGDRERRNDSLAVATAAVTIQGNAYTNAPTSGDAYEVWTIQPRIGFRLLQQTMENFVQPDLQPLGRFDDSDMSDLLATNYQQSGAGTLTKVTAATNVFSGAQALFFNAGTLGEYFETPSVRVQAGQNYWGASTYRVDQGGPVYLAVWDKTNNAEIDSSNRAGHRQEQFMAVHRTFTTPAGCEEVAFRVYVTGASDDVYVDHFQGPFKGTDYILPVPQYLSRSDYLRKLYTARYDLQVEGHVFDPYSRVLDEVLGRHYDARFGYHHATQGTIELLDMQHPQEEMWAETLRKASDLTTWEFTATGEGTPVTDIDRHLLALAWADRVCRHVLSYRPDDEEVQGSQRLLLPELQRMLNDYQESLEVPQKVMYHPLHGRSFSGV